MFSLKTPVSYSSCLSGLWIVLRVHFQSIHTHTTHPVSAGEESKSPTVFIWSRSHEQGQTFLLLSSPLTLPLQRPACNLRLGKGTEASSSPATLPSFLPPSLPFSLSLSLSLSLIYSSSCPLLPSDTRPIGFIRSPSHQRAMYESHPFPLFPPSPSTSPSTSCPRLLPFSNTSPVLG